MNEVSVGQPAPDFSLPAADGTIVRLSQFRGKKVILYFYPRDNTPACSAQARSFSEAFQVLEKAGAVIIGISRDSIFSHAKFSTKLELPFLLLSDTDEQACRNYKVIREKNMYGKKVMGIERSTFIINEQGIVTHEFRKVKVAGQIDSLLAALQK